MLEDFFYCRLGGTVQYSYNQQARIYFVMYTKWRCSNAHSLGTRPCISFATIDHCCLRAIFRPEPQSQGGRWVFAPGSLIFFIVFSPTLRGSLLVASFVFHGILSLNKNGAPISAPNFSSLAYKFLDGSPCHEGIVYVHSSEHLSKSWFRPKPWFKLVWTW
jgi:hypothetical protein